MPELSQGSDQRALLTVGEITDQGFLVLDKTTGQGQMVLSGDPNRVDLAEAQQEARNRFDRILGVLRAFKHGRGELKAETIRSHVRDEYGNQIVRPGTVKAYATIPGAMEGFAASAQKGIRASHRLSDAIRLFGRPNRDASEYYIIYELAESEFGDSKGIRQTLGVSTSSQTRFTRSANKLAPEKGGRHASDASADAPMDLEPMSRFVGELLASWIRNY